MELQSSLDEITKKIKSLENDWMENTAENALEIGKALKEAQAGKIYKQRYGTFEQYVEGNFLFKRSHAYNFIAIYEKFSQNVQQLDKMKKFGIRGLLLCLTVPDDYIEEMIEEVEIIRNKNPKTNVQQLAKVVKRFSKQSGSEPRHQNALNREDAKEEHLLKLKREAMSFHNRAIEIEQAQIALKEGIKKWELSALKYAELAQQIKEMRYLWNDL